MGFIPEDLLQQILDAADIRQVVQEYVPLKKRGRNWVGLCPFHSDKDPSFTVSEDKQIFYCFGCGEGGNIIKFLMRIDGLSFVEAARALAGRYGIEIPSVHSSARSRKVTSEREQLLALNEAACSFFVENLKNSKIGVDAQAYLSRRGLSQETIERFSLGWAPDSWDSLVNFFTERGMDLSSAEKAGLIVARSNAPGYYDRFRGRIIFPIQDHRGRTVAFGGRIIEENPKVEQPKYLNSPETPVYHKGLILYGLYQNRDAIRRAGQGFVVEGYMDLVSLFQAGVRETVATLGTALTREQVQRMKGVAKNWILLFDGDEAGRKAAKRALPIFYGFNLSPRVLSLPDGEDPDSFVRSMGRDAVMDLSAQAPNGVDFLIQTGREIYGTDVEGRHETAEELLEILAAVADPVRKSLLAGHIAQRLGIRESSIWERLSKQESRSRWRGAGREAESAESDRPAATDISGAVRAEQKLIGFLLAHPTVLSEFIDERLEIWLPDQRLKAIWDAVVNLYNMSGTVEMGLLSEILEGLPELRAFAMRLVAESPPCQDLEAMTRDLKEYCRSRRKKALRQELIAQMRECAPEEGELLLKQLQGLRL